MKFNLKGKTAIVTGGGSGIGKAIAISLAGNGAQVHVLELQATLAKETIDANTQKKGVATAHK